MTKSDEPKGMSGWSLAAIGAVLLAIGIALFFLDSAGAIDAHSYPAVVFSPVSAGVLLLIMGVVLGIKGSRVETDGRNRYGKQMEKDSDEDRHSAPEKQAIPDGRRGVPNQPTHGSS